MSQIARSLQETRARLERAARAAERDPAAIRLLAVSKTKPASAIREAYAAGQRDFGENYVQELVAKAEELADLPDLRWHFIGHLQTNKAKLAATVAGTIHSVDSARLAAELGRRAGGRSAPLVVLVEVNVGGEAQKSGCSVEQLGEVLDAVAAQPHLQLAGLMTVPPHTEDPEGARPFFRRLAELRDQHGGASRLPELSMGMTHDLEVAIAEGATQVRVGTAIFGARS